MSTAAAADSYRAVILREDIGNDRSRLAEVRSDSRVEVLDLRAAMTAELRDIRPAPTGAELDEPTRWCYFPWRHALVHSLGPSAFHRLRFDRNRNKITAAEQDYFSGFKVGVVGLSVGHAIAHTLALEGLCGELRLADFDSIELSNLNRVPASILDIGVNKAVVAARRIAELDPYLRVEIFAAGLTQPTIEPFLDGLDLVIEECDSLDVKVRLRHEARARGVPVLMQTSDRGLFDVERFDLEPDRPLFHGLLGGPVNPESLAHLTTRNKAPYVMQILQAPELSARMAASMIEIDRTVSTWPQLGGDVQLGAATVAAAVRRWGSGDALSSGRIRVDLEVHLDALDRQPLYESPATDQPTADQAVGADLTLGIPPDPLDAVVHAIRLAPSGGNSQPWSIAKGPGRVDILLATARSSALDVGFRASYVAIGAAGFNARVAAARHAVVGRLSEFPHGAGSDVVLSLELGTGADGQLAATYPAMIERISNRSLGVRSPIPQPVAAELRRAAETEGAKLCLITDEDQLAALSDIIAESDRLRYLTPVLHEQMMSELRWPGIDRMDLGIDVRTLGLDPVDLAKLQVAGRGDVMALLASWGGGIALGDDTRSRIMASSAVAVITVGQASAREYLHGGAAAERVWICANQNGLGVQPVSPVFLYARNEEDRNGLSPGFSSELAALQQRFEGVLGLAADQPPALVVRMSHHVGPVVRSARLPLTAILTAVAPSGETAHR